ncbi:MAG: hypothetical protein WC533_03870 [Candidatus Pacearchaeota archaeon]
MKKTTYVLIGFALVLIGFAIFSTKLGFHDSYEYITVSKILAGVDNLDVFTTHSLVYPFIISLFLKIWPSLTMIKLVNVFWVFLIGIVLLIFLKNKFAFLIFAISPLTWYASIQTTPALPASFCLLLAYLFIKNQKIKHSYIYSGLFLGLSVAFYTPMMLFSFLFILVYFWNGRFNNFVNYFIFFSIGILPALVLDYVLFNNPMYSFIRYFGANFVVSIAGVSSGTRNLQILNTPGVLLIIVAISPFLFRLHRLKFEEHKKDIIFLILSGLILLVRAAMLKYFIIISPILILLLSPLLTKKEIKWHCVVSVILIVILTFGFFGATKDSKIQEDLLKIKGDFKTEYIIAGPYEAPKIAAQLWEDSPKIAWIEDFEASRENKTVLKEYSIKTNSKINLRENLEISAKFNRFGDYNYDNYIIVSEKESELPEGLEKEKCYSILCVYRG